MTTTTVATYECAPGDRAGVLALLEPARLATIAEEGCEYFLVLLPDDDANRILLIEGWRSEEDLLAHRRTPHFQEIILGVIAARVLCRDVTVAAQNSRY